MKNTYKIIMLLAFFCINAIVMPLTAKDSERFLPLSVKSEAAKALYHESLELLSNAHVNQYKAKLEEAIKADPNFFMAHAHRALAESSFDTSNKSNSFIETALALPHDELTPAEASVRKILVKLQGDRKSETTKHDLKTLLDELVSANSTTIEAYETATSVARFILDNDELAAVYTQKLSKIDPDYAPAYNILGYYYMEKNEMPKAKEAFENYVRLAPGEANAHDSMGDYYMKAGEYEKSAEQFDKAVAMGMDVSRERAEKARNLAHGDTETTPIPDNE